MSSNDQSRGRIKPEDSDDDDIDDPIEFSENVEGKFRSRVNQYGDRAQFPTAPLYSVGEIVYLASHSSQSQPEGPYVVVSVSADRYYTIKRRDNGQQYPDSVAESRLLVRTS
ncbi:hypothetical protein M434DRAFT_36270 [Hypoxylon sp. CO27-5]|nr:hypothetical protein M434DRAFT_36270 [Hypoxylon sp. CO27-5]